MFIMSYRISYSIITIAKDHCPKRKKDVKTPPVIKDVYWYFRAIAYPSKPASVSYDALSYSIISYKCNAPLGELRRHRWEVTVAYSTTH
jgi:hypothetical protein